MRSSKTSSRNSRFQCLIYPSRDFFCEMFLCRCYYWFWCTHSRQHQSPWNWTLRDSTPEKFSISEKIFNILSSMSKPEQKGHDINNIDDDQQQIATRFFHLFLVFLPKLHIFPLFFDPKLALLVQQKEMAFSSFLIFFYGYIFLFIRFINNSNTRGEFNRKYVFRLSTSILGGPWFFDVSRYLKIAERYF